MIVILLLLMFGIPIDGRIAVQVGHINGSLAGLIHLIPGARVASGASREGSRETFDSRRRGSSIRHRGDCHSAELSRRCTGKGHVHW